MKIGTFIKRFAVGSLAVACLASVAACGPGSSKSQSEAPAEEIAPVCEEAPAGETAPCAEQETKEPERVTVHPRRARIDPTTIACAEDFQDWDEFGCRS